VLVCFGARACPGRRALLPALERVTTACAGRLLIATVLLDDAPLLAEQYSIVASPTLMVFQHGERQGQVIGFIADGLVDLLVDDILQGAITGDILWSPVEARFEDAVLLPLIQGWGFTVQRQVACTLVIGQKPQRGRIDLLVYGDAQGLPLTLIESKRQIWGDYELRQATRQAAAYAQALALPTFVVAAPRGLWRYQCGEQPICIDHVTSLELHQDPAKVRQLLSALPKFF
jgi:thioredoxin 1